MVTTKDEILVYDEIYLYFDMVDFLHDKYEKILNDVKEKIKEPQKPNVYQKKWEQMKFWISMRQMFLMCQWFHVNQKVWCHINQEL